MTPIKGGYKGGDLNPNHYSFPRVSNHRTPGWLYPPPDIADKWVFWVVVVLWLGALVLL